MMLLTGITFTLPTAYLAGEFMDHGGWCNLAGALFFGSLAGAAFGMALGG